MSNDLTDARMSGDCATGSDAGGSETASYLSASLPPPIPSAGGSISGASSSSLMTTPGAVSAASGGFSWEPTKRGAAPLALLLQWLGEGLTIYAIAKRIGRDPSTVKKRLERYLHPRVVVSPEQRQAEFRDRVAALWARGMTQSEICAQIHACERRVRQVVKDLPPRPRRAPAPTQAFTAKCAAFVEMVRAGSSFSAARIALGLGKKQYRRLVIEHGLVSRPAGRKPSLRPRREKAPPIARIGKAPNAAPPNPYRTPAQQAQIENMKAATYMLSRGRDTRAVPPPENAEQLIRDAIAAGRITRCPTRFAAPVNNGDGL